ncbi:transcription initiation factor IIB family protein [Candidatus Woesearchaeota archaeon]|nr:transcription initiation factor IIB family protein [Candidatus Woesearchaeota archaeon]MCF7901765.1 transcription initiation factor IIB family protein [Candidatus Woesearchaeota archaeon]MCF8013166.1 transcription initiation factor IIB family protein [Candidatus Woesearchaeota archaeon]
MQPSNCPECGSINLHINLQASEIICNDCGLVIEENGIEQNPYVSESTKKNARLPQLATAGSKEIDGKIWKKSWLLSTKEKNMRYGMSRITALAGKLHLPEFVTQEAKVIFKQAMDKDLAIGRDIISFSYSSVYSACIIHNLPKTLLEVIVHSSVRKTRLMRAYKVLRKELSLMIPVVDPIDLIPRFASKLELSQSTVTKANELAMKISEEGLLSGKRPETIVATALYLASRMNEEPRTQRDVANAVGVIEVTIRNSAKKVVF